MKHLAAYILLLPLLLLGSCVNDDTVDGEVIPLFTDIVTFEGNVDDHATFTFNKVDDSPEVYLTADKRLGGDIEAGSRLLLAYQPAAEQGAYESGPIVMRAVSEINQDEISVMTTEQMEGWNVDPVFVYSIWRTGIYINLHCRLPYSVDPRRFGLAAKESTIDNPIVDVFLVHQLKEPVNSYDRMYYASFDISSIWNRPTCQGIRLHVANSNLNKNEFEILKQN